MYLEGQLDHGIGADAGLFAELLSEDMGALKGVDLEVTTAFVVELSLGKQHLLAETLVHVPLEALHSWQWQSRQQRSA